VSRPDVGNLAKYPDHIELLDSKLVGLPVGCIAMNSSRMITVAPSYSSFIGPNNDVCATWPTADSVIRLQPTSEHEQGTKVAIKGSHSPGASITCLQVSTNGTVMVSGATDCSIIVSK
jgi:hypothetical protein